VPSSEVARHVNPSYGIALGPGPAYPVPFRDGTLRYDHGRRRGRMDLREGALDHLGPATAGRCLCEVTSSTGPTGLGFETGGAHPLDELQIPPVGGGIPT